MIIRISSAAIAPTSMINSIKSKALVSNERSRTNDFNLFSQESCNSEQQDNHFNTIASTALTKQLSADSTNSSTFDLS
ncbi:hypothetical protein E3P92_02603 [Wallemia ichthyophaga]|nr:hypothetical protein E3P91_02596 [Wallemia ichthyophaga]TIB12289.1 hypothetical protein E3P92_02603 [Wallemia ichthyophaga]